MDDWGKWWLHTRTHTHRIAQCLETPSSFGNGDFGFGKVLVWQRFLSSLSPRDRVIPAPSVFALHLQCRTTGSLFHSACCMGRLRETSATSTLCELGILCHIDADPNPSLQLCIHACADFVVFQLALHSCPSCESCNTSDALLEGQAELRACLHLSRPDVDKTKRKRSLPFYPSVCKKVFGKVSFRPQAASSRNRDKRARNSERT